MSVRCCMTKDTAYPIQKSTPPQKLNQFVHQVSLNTSCLRNGRIVPAGNQSCQHIRLVIGIWSGNKARVAAL